VKTVKAGIVSIGDELLNGSSVDTNSAYLSEKFLSIGIPVAMVRMVGDDCDAIVGALRAASDEAEIILTTGGLGPTDDDLTRRAVSEHCGKELKLDEASLADIEGFYADWNGAGYNGHRRGKDDFRPARCSGRNEANIRAICPAKAG
jgi:nicotinamide-nucleotide amidase